MLRNEDREERTTGSADGTTQASGPGAGVWLVNHELPNDKGLSREEGVGRSGPDVATLSHCSEIGANDKEGNQLGAEHEAELTDFRFWAEVFEVHGFFCRSARRALLSAHRKVPFRSSCVSCIFDMTAQSLLGTMPFLVVYQKSKVHSSQW